jgi:glycosyltransferase involved in cell wall biosynthesis
MIRQGHEVKVFFPDCRFDSADLDKYYGNPDVYHIWEFPIKGDDVELYTFPLILPDPHPRNYRNAWMFKDMTEKQFGFYMSEFKRQIKSIIGSFEPDIIECQHIWAMGHAIMELGHPYVIVAHHSDQMAFMIDQRMRPYAVRAAQSAEYILAISDFVRDEVLRLYPVEPEKVLSTGSGYNKEIFYPRRVNREELLADFDLVIPEHVPMITVAGKMSKTKGIDILLLANQMIQQQQEVHFLLFGSGELQDVLDEDKSHLYCLDNVHIMGHQSFDTLAKFHSVASASVLPSRSEGFGIGALEAMGCGAPLVVTQTGGPEEFAIGKVVEKENPEQLAEAILDILSLSLDEHRALCREACRRAQEFSWECITERRLELYERVRRNTQIAGTSS